MRNIFIILYDWFKSHKFYFYCILTLLVVLCGYSASRIKLEENISSFFDDEDNKSLNHEFLENFKLKDRIVVLISGSNPDTIIQVASDFTEKIQPLLNDKLIKSINDQVDQSSVDNSINFIYNHLPIYLEESDYKYLEDKLTESGIKSSIDSCYTMLTSPSSMVIGDVIKKDPLNIGTPFLKKFERFSSGFEYELYGGYVFSKDLSTMLIYLDPTNGMANTGDNERLVKGLESAIKQSKIKDVSIQCIGGPIVAVYNARQIKTDTMLTMGLALLVLIPIILFSFRSKRSIPLIFLPPVFGALFALAIIALLKGSISAIAVGAGAVVLGISISYSIHIISHSNHTENPKQIIADLSYPLTIGCLTTIGAFIALLFTHSKLLQDMGLFSALTLIGTTLFSLIFLPHFIPMEKGKKKNRFLDFIEHCNGYAYENKKYVIATISVLTFICLFFYNDVKFDDNMSNINYLPAQIELAEKKARALTGDNSQLVYIVSSGKGILDAQVKYQQLSQLCDTLHQAKLVNAYIEVNDFIIPLDEQQKRINRWNQFWNKHKTATVDQINKYAKLKGFSPEAFAEFEQSLNKKYTVCRYSPSELEKMPLLSDWVTAKEQSFSLISRISVQPNHKEAVYQKIDSIGGNLIIDRAYFSSKMVKNTSLDFNFILLISSLLVFVALFISYGRIELTLITFLPMCISWIIILGFMAILDIKFNIVNIILATFIFGIGDDFSIFIMDGLLQEYKNGKKILNAHKSAIFFSALTTIIGMGVLIFAKHPALKSIAVISVLGLCVVVLVAYTVQPFLFNLLITKQVKNGGFPHTIRSIFNTFYSFIYFFVGCIILSIDILLLTLCPFNKKKKKELFHYHIYTFTRFFLQTMFMVKMERQNPFEENYKKPAIIIANHQSIVDILLLLSTTPKIIMLTKNWVWNSPFFGQIIQYADFHHTGDGYEKLVEELKPKVEAGYSIVVFPEGTRSKDFSIQRFHKGAFYLASVLKLDILPILFYGPGQVSSKQQPFYIKKGLLVVKTMKRFRYGDQSMGESYQEQSKAYRRWFRKEYSQVEEEYSRTSNIYFRHALIKNYTYKGPVLEWYMRIKCRLDGYYNFWDRIIPRKAKITDLGCGYGQLGIMLGILSTDREIIGIDYDENKIALANHSFLCGNNVHFICQDMRNIELSPSDAFIFNDSLHYASQDRQEQILINCLSMLNDGGLIIVRDGDASNHDQHKSILRTELWSTKILKFNKTGEPLQFVSKSWMFDFALKNNLSITTERCDKTTSETIYIFKKKVQG